MKTSSCWGTPCSRVYRFIQKYGHDVNSIYVVGCSDGKYVFPFLRKGYDVTATDMDSIALYGGEKERPVFRTYIPTIKYQHHECEPEFIQLPSEKINILGLAQRAQIEKLDNNLHIIENDAYHNPINQKFDVVFTSCSIHYKSNRDLSLEHIISILKNSVNKNGFLFIDYMMPLEESHIWKTELMPRNGQIKKLFLDGWDIKYIYEMKKPIFEAAHVDRPEDHFHRFGYLLAQKNVLD